MTRKGRSSWDGFPTTDSLISTGPRKHPAGTLSQYVDDWRLGIEATPIAWKLLNVLRFFSRLWNTLEHNRGYFLDGFAVSIPENVGIDPKSDAGICVP